MQQDESNSKLSVKQEEAALLLVEGVLTDEQIAAKVGVHRITLIRWKKLEAFAARIEGFLADVRQEIRKRGIAIVENRVAALQDRHDRMVRVISERAADPKMATVPGGTTGLLVHNVKSIGAGPTAEKVDLYEVDTGLLKEMREHEKQAAQELGQWTEHSDVTSAGQSLVKVLRGVSMDEL